MAVAMAMAMVEHRGLDHWCLPEMLKDIFDFLRQKFGMVEESRNEFIGSFCLLFDFYRKKDI
jgi:hypothetical protein